MHHSLSIQEINHRLIRLRNLERLYPELKAKYEQVKDENRVLKKRVVVLESAVTTQQQTIQSLQLQIEELKRMIFGRRKRKDYGENDDDSSSFSSPSQSTIERDASSYHRRIPYQEEITKEETHTIDVCASCCTPLTRIKTVVFYEEDILLPDTPASFKEVTRHTAEKGFCNQCMMWRPALPLPPTPVVIGPKVRAFVSYASVILRLSYAQIQHLLHDLYAFPLSQGEITYILEREARKLTHPHEQLKQTIREQNGVHYDETGWKVREGTQGNYAWVMTGTETKDAVFLIGRSRGKGNAEELKGEKYTTHIGITDDYGTYRNLFAYHQLCWAHPLRKLRDLGQSEMLDPSTRIHCHQVYREFSSLYTDLRAVLGTPFDLMRRMETREKLIARFHAIAALHDHDPKKLQMIKEGLNKNTDSYFTCLVHEGIPPDNNKAERALRHLVLKRKISFGSCSQRGADTLGVLVSVLLSLWWRKPKYFFQEYLALRGV